MNAFETLLVPEKTGMRFEVGMASASCEWHPERNDDTILANPITGLFGVFDGISGSKHEMSGKNDMGGSNSGWAASAKASRVIDEQMNITLNLKNMSKVDIEGALSNAMTTARNSITDGDTTALPFIIWGERDQRRLSFAHTGNSRLYVFNSMTGALSLITEDHSLLLALKPSMRRQVAKKLDNAISEEDLKKDRSRIPIDDPGLAAPFIGYKDYTNLLELFENRHYLLGSLRGARNLCDTGTISLNPGDLVFAASDGLENLTRKQLSEIAGDLFDKPQRFVQTLVHQANAVSRRCKTDEVTGEPPLLRADVDDISALAVRVHEGKLSSMNNFSYANIY